MAKTKAKQQTNTAPAPELVYEYETDAPAGGFVVKHKPSGSWWCAGRNGYTGNLLTAGVYSETEAREIEKLRGEDEAVPLAQAVRDFLGPGRPNATIMATVAAMGAR